MRFENLKKIFVLLVAAGSVSLVSLSNLNAQGGSPTQVVEVGTLLTTTQTIAASLTNPNSSPGLLSSVNAILTLMTNAGWGSTENDSKLSPNVVSDMSSLGQAAATNSLTTLISQQQPFNAQLVSTNQLTPAPPSSPNAFNPNNLMFSSVFGQPYFSQPACPTNQPNCYATNWLLYASGLNTQHVIPGPGWQGKNISVYQNYFNAAIVSSSFNAYALSTLENYNNSALASLEQQVMQEVSNMTNWFATIESESIGWVLRQILMFQSIAVVYLIRLTQINENILVELALTNNLQMAANGQMESTMVMQASGAKPA